MENIYAGNARQILPTLGMQGPVVSREEQAVVAAAKTITASSDSGAGKTYGRNDRVVISNGNEQREMKYKKAESLLASGGWHIVE